MRKHFSHLASSNFDLRAQATERIEEENATSFMVPGGFNLFMRVQLTFNKSWKFISTFGECIDN